MNRFIFTVLALISTQGCKRAVYELDGPALFVVNGGSHSISIVDLETNSVSDVLTLKDDARFPHHIYLSPGKQKFAISITDTDLSGGHVHSSDPNKSYMVMIFESASGKLLETIKLEGMAHNAVFSPDGKELWLGESGEPESKVRVLETAKYTEIATFAVGEGLSEVTFSADGSRAYAANTTSNTVSIIDPETKQVIKTITVGSTPVGAWPGTNGRMYVDNEGAYSITEIDVAGDSILSTFSVGAKPGYAAYHGVRNELWVSDATNGKVKIFEEGPNGWSATAEISTGADAHAIVFSTNGLFAYVSNQGSGSVSVVDVVTRQKVTDIAVESMPNGLAYFD